jgi:hypothetical protein
MKNVLTSDETKRNLQIAIRQGASHFTKPIMNINKYFTSGISESKDQLINRIPVFPFHI